MIVTLWGTRGSLPVAGPETVRYGGNTPCIEVRDGEGAILVLDAGSGIRRLGAAIGSDARRVYLLLTHLHMDHIQGMGFFDPLYVPDMEVHIWGPATTTLHLRARLARYLSPPLFPAHLRDVPCRLTFHDVPRGRFEVDGFQITSDLVCHPGFTLGYRIERQGASLAYLPDHEPALGVRHFPEAPHWTSGFALAEGVDVLIHDAQYTQAEYRAHLGGGHSSISQAMRFAAAAGVGQLVTFHHDPAHTDDYLDRLHRRVLEATDLPFALVPGREGLQLAVGS